MRRIDDFVKLLVGLVIGQFFRDIHNIRDVLRAPMAPHGAFLTEVFPYVFVALVIRNIHASFRYDSWASARKFSPAYEKHVVGRGWSFGASVLALFVATYAVEHFLASHFAHIDASQTRKSIDQLDVAWLTAFLLLPFVVYLLWDIALWLATDAPNVRRDKVMQRFIRTWLILDALGMAWLLLCLAYTSFRGGGPDTGLLRTLTAFTVLAALTIVADYVKNASFYFAEVRSSD